MAGATTISWTEQTWNPIVGCSILSPGCTNCYAMRMAWRFKESYVGREIAGARAAGVVRKVNGNPVWTGQLALAPDPAFLAPLRRKKPTLYFVNSMSDLFHEDCPDEWIDRVFAVMALSPHHTFQVLTKRAERMRDYLTSRNGMGNAALCKAINDIPANMGNRHGALEMPLPNVWLGVSAERQQEADERIPLLLQTPAAVRFVSAEPLLGPIDLNRVSFGEGDPRHKRDALTGQARMFANGVNGNPDMTILTTFEKPMTALDWIIVGGESGPHARSMHPGWVWGIRDQCVEAGVAFHFKQWGEWAPSTEEKAAGNPRSGWQANRAYPHVAKAAELYPQAGAAFVERVGKKAAGRLLDGIEHNGFPTARAL